LSQVLTQAQDHNLSLQLRALEVDNAKQEAIKFTHAAAPVVELIAAVSKEQLHGQGDFGASNNSQSQKMLGLSLSLPLYTAGWRDGKLKESQASSDKRIAEYDVSHAQLLQAIKSAWMSLKSAPERLLAYDEALTASAARRDATRTGRQVGDKTTLELLNAENDLLQAHVSALQARLEALYNQAKLDVLRGRLTFNTFKRINDALAL
jgi:outer membrane protein